MRCEAAARAIREGYEFGCRLRQHGAQPNQFVQNVLMWVDGFERPYRNHALRPHYFAGFAAGYHDKACPPA